MISHKDETNISARFSLLLTVLNWGTAGPSGNNSTSEEENHPRDGGSAAVTSRLETEDEPVDPAQLGVCQGQLPGNNGLYCAGCHVGTRFVYVFLGVTLGDNVWLLFSLFECHKGSRDLQLPGPQDKPVFFQKLGNPVTCLRFCFCDSTLFTSKHRRSRFSCGRRVWAQEVPRQSFAVSPWKGEEEWDKAKASGMTASQRQGNPLPRACERLMRVQRLCKLVCPKKGHIHNKTFLL